LSLLVDTTPPPAPTKPDLLASSDTGRSDSDDVTRKTRPVFVGTGEAGATVTLYDGSKAIGSAEADASGAWSIKSAVLRDGIHAVRARASDAAGNNSAFTPFLEVTIDAAVSGAAGTLDLASSSASFAAGPRAADAAGNDAFVKSLSDWKTGSLGFDDPFQEAAPHQNGDIVELFNSMSQLIGPGMAAPPPFVPYGQPATGGSDPIQIDMANSSTSLYANSL
jgi:hypothetical protein